MPRYILRRLGLIVLTLFVASLIIFTVTQFLPGDVARTILGQFASETAVQNLREQLGLNRPAHVQYIDWLWHFVRGDWGVSLTTKVPVHSLVFDRLWNSSWLAFLALVFYVPMGIFLGVWAALRKDKPTDSIITAFGMTFVGLPEFVTGLVLISVFAFGLHWLPANSSIDPNVGFVEAFPQLVLPAVTVSLVSLGYILRMTRASTVKVMDADYTRAAYLKGLPRFQVLTKHVLRNSLLPTVTVVFMGIGWLIGGLIVTEQVFGYPGLGRLIVSAVQKQDLPVIQASSMIVVTVFAVSNLIADLLYVVLNPRIRLN
jgi:peptide/nickel transport system permease protein